MKPIINEETERIEFLDERFYKVGEDKYYPSVTHILNLYPKDVAFDEFLMDYGRDARIKRDKAAESGTKVHNAIESGLSGVELNWDGENYTKEEWEGILRFEDFKKKFEVKPVAFEITVISHKYEYAGTLDLICNINNELWLIDYKFANAIYEENFHQVSAYVKAFEEQNEGYKIQKAGVLHLKAKTKGYREGKIQGAGWQLKEVPGTFDFHFGLFMKTFDIYKYKNPNAKPKNLSYPTKIKL